MYKTRFRFPAILIMSVVLLGMAGNSLFASVSGSREPASQTIMDSFAKSGVGVDVIAQVVAAPIPPTPAASVPASEAPTDEYYAYNYYEEEEVSPPDPAPVAAPQPAAPVVPAPVVTPTPTPTPDPTPKPDPVPCPPTPGGG